jgi:hypothetical protein
MAAKKKKEEASKGRKGLEFEDIMAFLSRFQVSGVNWNDFPPPPEGKAERFALAGMGGLTALSGVGLVLYGLIGLNGVFLSAGMALGGLGGAATLYVLPDLAVFRKPMLAHPSTTEGDVRSLGETLLTMTAVVGFVNAGVGLILSAAVYVMIHWSVSLGVALLLNLGAAYVGYRGDGENRRPVLPEAPAAAPEEPAGEDAAAT